MPAEWGVEDIVVTAQQRSQSLQDVPLAVTALTGGLIEQAHIATFSDLAKIAPGFVSGANYGFIRFSSMRGISNNQFGFADDPSIAMFVDGVYQGRGGSGMQTNAFYDVERVEVIKGPQATLFGRSSIGGAISVITKQPTVDRVSGEGMAGLGERGRMIARGAINVPLSPNLAVRFAANSESRNNIYRNLNGGGLGATDIKAARATLRYVGDNGADISLKANVEHREGPGMITQRVGLPDFTVDSTLRGRQDFSDFKIYDAVLKIVYPFSDALSVTSLTSGRQVKNRFITDYDGMSAVVAGPYFQRSNDRLFQQDLIFNFDSPGFSAIFGGSYFNEKVDAFVSNYVNSTFAFTGSPTPGLVAGDYALAFYEPGDLRGKFNGYSLFADATVELAPDLKLTGGVRYNSDSKRLTQDIPNPAIVPENAGKPFAGAYYNWGYWTSTPLTSSKTWRDLAFRAALSYEISPRLTVYASYNEGWKAGGIDSFKIVTPAPFQYFFGRDAAAAGGRPNVYDPEGSQSYELGLKGRFLDNRLSANIALYQYDYEDLQFSVTQGGSSVISNVGKARGRGVESELRLVPNDNIDLFGNVAYNHTRIRKFDEIPTLVGLPLAQAPRWTGAAGVTLKSRDIVPGEVSVGGDMSFRSRYRVGTFTTSLVDSYTLFNARLTYTVPSERFSITVFADNIFDKFTYSSASTPRPFASIVPIRSVLGDPRVIGVDLRANF